MLRHYWRVMTEPGKTANKRPFNNKYECTIDQELTGADAEAIDVLQTQCERSPGGSTCLGETTSWPPSGKCDVKLKIWGDKWTGESPGNKRADESPCETSDQVSHQVRQVTRRVTRWVTRWDEWRGESSGETSDQVRPGTRWVTKWETRWVVKLLRLLHFLSWSHRWSNEQPRSRHGNQYMHPEIEMSVTHMHITAGSVIGYWHHHNVVCPSVTLCTVVKWYILQQKCLNKWTGSAPIGTQFHNSQPTTLILKSPRLAGHHHHIFVWQKVDGQLTW